MSVKVRKAVIPAAGLGTRVLPITKSMPKEMLPIVDKPAIQYIVEEAVAAGIEDILVVTGRGKNLIEDHFDHSYELEDVLRRKGRDAVADRVAALARLANIHYVRQHQPKGLGHAIMAARTFVGDEPFAVLYGDDVIMSEHSVIGQLCEQYDRFGKGVVGVKEVPEEDVVRYCSLKVDAIEDKLFAVSDIIEKPRREQIYSCYSILGRCILPPKIFDLLDNTAPGTNGEIQLTDAMAELSRQDGMIALDFDGIHYDMGNKLCIMKAQIEVALKNPDFGDEFRAYLKEFAKTL